MNSFPHWRSFFFLSALLLPIGGLQHPDGTMAEMLAHPAWVRAHAFMLAGFLALFVGLFFLRSHATLQETIGDVRGPPSTTPIRSNPPRRGDGVRRRRVAHEASNLRRWVTVLIKRVGGPAPVGGVLVRGEPCQRAFETGLLWPSARLEQHKGDHARRIPVALSQTRSV